MANVSKGYPYVESDLAYHPGELLAEELEVRELSQKALAELMGRPVQVVNEICRGRKAVTADTALDLEQVLGIDARLWLNLQTQYDLVKARQRRSSAA
jgi:HTH-type transcriptional regulator/antitoxin HigA